MTFRRIWLFLPLVTLLVFPTVSYAQEKNAACKVASDNVAKATGNPTIPFTPEVDIPGIFYGKQNITGASIGEYIRAVYIFFVWIVGLLAVVMIIYGGIRWVAAAGNPAKISAARETVQNAIAGVVLALTSVVILNTINPQLTQLTNLDLHAVSACELVFIDEAVKAAGPIISQCPANTVADPANTYCTRSTGCHSGLNDLINRSADNYKIDPILLKAIAKLETIPKIGTNGAPFSGPAHVPESPGSSRLSSSYGFGQIIAKSLPGYARDARVLLPEPCKQELAKLRKPTGELIDACANALDENPQLQFDMMAGGLAAVQRANQVSSQPVVLAMAWHLGQQGARNYFQGTGSIGDTSFEAAKKYSEKFNSIYTKMCNASVNFLQQQPNPRGF